MIPFISMKFCNFIKVKNNKIVPEEDINKNDFIIALDYLEEYQSVKLDKVMSTNLHFFNQSKTKDRRFSLF